MAEYGAVRRAFGELQYELPDTPGGREAAARVHALGLKFGLRPGALAAEYEAWAMAETPEAAVTPPLVVRFESHLQVRGPLLAPFPGLPPPPQPPPHPGGG